MDINEAAKILDGGEYGEEVSKAQAKVLKDHGLVAVFGASDDLMEFRGAIDDEVGAPGKAYLNNEGLINNRCDADDCPYHKDELRGAATIEAVWRAADGEPNWTFKTKIPHATFIINEDGEPFCRGIVFALKDVEPS